jgi:membrane protease subunit (stomatin/prohibitin family)
MAPKKDQAPTADEVRDEQQAAAEADPASGAGFQGTQRAAEAKAAEQDANRDARPTADEKREATEAVEDRREVQDRETALALAQTDKRRQELMGVAPQPGGVPRPMDEPPADKPTFVRCWNCGGLKPAPRFPGRERLETHPDLAAPVDEFCPNCGKGELVAGSLNGPTAVVTPSGQPLPPAWQPER